MLEKDFLTGLAFGIIFGAGIITFLHICIFGTKYIGKFLRFLKRKYDSFEPEDIIGRTGSDFEELLDEERQEILDGMEWKEKKSPNKRKG